MKTCVSYAEDVSALIDRELPDDCQKDLFQHLATCESCRALHASMLSLHADLVACPDPRVPTTLDGRVARAARLRFTPATPLTERIRLFWKQRLAVPVPALAAGVLAMILALVVAYTALVLPPNLPQPHQQQVTYIMSLPTVEVQGTRLPPHQRIQ